MTMTELDQFTGTEKYYQHWLGIKYTDGVHYLAENAKAYWLIDLVASWQIELKKKYGSECKGGDVIDLCFQVWELKRVGTDNQFVVTCTDGDEKELCRQAIPFSDFPMDNMKLFFQEGVLFLPSEY